MAFTQEAREEGERPLPRGIRLRRGLADDEFATFDVMRRAMNYDMQWSQHVLLRQHLRTAPDTSFWIAEDTPLLGAPRVIGYARSVVRDTVWSLTEFFVLPGHHRQGIGSALLERCLADGAAAGAETRMVLASQHPGADSLYVRKAGCFPRIPMLLLSGPLISLCSARQHFMPIEDAALTLPGVISNQSSSQLRAEPLVRTPEIAAALDALDREIVGYARSQEHDFWEQAMGGPNGTARLFRRSASLGDGEIAGYAYIGATSSGPVLARDPADLPRMLMHAADVARALLKDDPLEPLDTVQQYWALAGTNETVLRWLLDCGWQIVFQYLFMSSRPFGRFDRYVCHNPLYIL
ncbi:MAG TPA: GNAT family N-acetyltransferase [Chthonomonadaceae bacterium]|nr:GNAT family N-acetyltransferase [Chthonomonadaceae bacterium]